MQPSHRCLYEPPLIIKRKMFYKKQFFEVSYLYLLSATVPTLALALSLMKKIFFDEIECLMFEIRSH